MAREIQRCNQFIPLEGIEDATYRAERQDLRAMQKNSDGLLNCITRRTIDSESSETTTWSYCALPAMWTRTKSEQ